MDEELPEVSTSDSEEHDVQMVELPEGHGTNACCTAGCLHILQLDHSTRLDEIRLALQAASGEEKKLLQWLGLQFMKKLTLFLPHMNLQLEVHFMHPRWELLKRWYCPPEHPDDGRRAYRNYHFMDVQLCRNAVARILLSSGPRVSRWASWLSEGHSDPPNDLRSERPHMESEQMQQADVLLVLGYRLSCSCAHAAWDGQDLPSVVEND